MGCLQKPLSLQNPLKKNQFRVIAVGGCDSKGWCSAMLDNGVKIESIKPVVGEIFGNRGSYFRITPYELVDTPRSYH